MRLVLVAALVLLTVGSACAAPVLVVDSQHSSYLHESDAPVKVDGAGLSGVTSALAGLMPPSGVDSELANKIDGIVKPSPLRKPRAHVVFNIAGVSSEELSEIFEDRRSRTVDVQAGEEHPASVVLDALANVAAANGGASLVMLEQQGLQACSGNCMDEHMPSAADLMNAQATEGGLAFESGAELSFGEMPDKAFAVEAATMLAGLKQQIELSMDEDEDLHVLEATMVGLHVLEQTYGSDSQVYKSAKAALLRVLKHSVQQLDAKYQGDVTYQAAGFGGVPDQTTVTGIMGWKEDVRRTLQATALGDSGTTWPPEDQEQASKEFTTKAAAYGAFILLLYFALAGVWCMCYMPMKEDTMLFGAKKTD